MIADKPDLRPTATQAQPVAMAEAPEAVDAAPPDPLVTLDDYMTQYAAHFYEWVEGEVIEMSPVNISHSRLVHYFILLFETYFELRPIGRIVSQPFVMRLPAFPNRRREPDLMIILNDNPHTLRETFMDGPADLVIEIVSPESGARDHGEKLIEYEQGGVREYWIIDPLRAEGRFYRLDAQGVYRRQTEDAQALYHTPALPGLALPVPTLWQPQLPGPLAIADQLRASLQG